MIDVMKVAKKQTAAIAPKQETIAEYIAWGEGKEHKPYKCSAGYLTIGIGRNLEDVGLAPDEIFHFQKKYGLADEEAVWAFLNNGIDDEDIQLLFSNDLVTAKKTATRLVPYLAQLDGNIQYVLIDLAFNIGQKRLQKFKKMLAAIGSYHMAKAPESLAEAAYELANSKYTLDTQRRAVRNCKKLCGDVALVVQRLKEAGKTEHVEVFNKWKEKV